MTCIVGVVSDNEIYMGGDSAGVSGWSLRVRADEKVFVNGDFIFGFTSSFRMGQILRFGFSPPKRHQDTDVYEYMVTSFVDSIRNRFRESGYLSEDKRQEVGGVFLVGYANRLFRVDSDFQVGETLNGFDAVGCGQDVALGALYAIQKATGFKEPDKAIEMALEASESYSAGVRRPFKISRLIGRDAKHDRDQAKP